MYHHHIIVCLISSDEGRGKRSIFFFLLFFSFCVGRSSLFFESFQSPVMDHDYLSIYLHTYSTYIPLSPPFPSSSS